MTMAKTAACFGSASAPDFAEAVEREQAASRIRSIQIIADSEDWRAHAWLQERRDPTNWGKQDIDGGGVAEKMAAYLQGRADQAAEDDDE